MEYVLIKQYVFPDGGIAAPQILKTTDSIGYGWKKYYVACLQDGSTGHLAVSFVEKDTYFFAKLTPGGSIPIDKEDMKNLQIHHRDHFYIDKDGVANIIHHQDFDARKKEEVAKTFNKIEKLSKPSLMDINRNTPESVYDIQAKLNEVIDRLNF